MGNTTIEARTADVVGPGEELVASVRARSGATFLRLALTTQQLLVWRQSWPGAAHRPVATFRLTQIDHFVVQRIGHRRDLTIAFVDGSVLPLQLVERASTRAFIDELRVWMAANPVPAHAVRHLPTEI